MALFDRLMGLEPNKIPVHTFSALMAEFARGRVTGAQAQAVIESVSGSPLTLPEATEAQTLLATITNAGNASAKLARAKEIDDVLLLAETNEPPYDTGAAVKARLGV